MHGGIRPSARSRHAMARLLAWPPLVMGPGFGPLRAPRNGGGRKPAEDLGLKFLFDHSADAMLVLNIQHVIVDANSPATLLFGRPLESLKGAPALEVDLLARML